LNCPALDRRASDKSYYLIIMIIIMNISMNITTNIGNCISMIIRTNIINCISKCLFSGESIRPADPIVFDRIRIGFHRNPTFFIKTRSDPTEFLSGSYRSDLVEFQSCSVEFRRNPDRNPTKTLSDPIEIISIRRDPITPQSHGLSFT
jgi:hypothetical protein